MVRASEYRSRGLHLEVPSSPYISMALEEMCMREAESESKTATIILAALAALAVACFVFAGVAMFEQLTVTATSSLPATPHMRGQAS